MRALSVCSTPDCPNTTERGQCRVCRRRADRRRPNSHQRGYDHRWAATRCSYLAVHPVCEDESGCTEMATDVHHIDGQGPLGPRGHDWTNLKSLCHHHHSARTAAERPSGWAAR